MEGLKITNGKGCNLANGVGYEMFKSLNITQEPNSV